MQFQKALLVLAGIATVVVGVEAGLRVVGDWLPEPMVWPNVETEVKSRQLADGPSWAVVFLGSSVTEAAVDPDRLEDHQAYNAALPFSNVRANLVWYDAMFAPRPGRVVVLGIPPSGFDAGDDWGLDDGISAALAATRQLDGELLRRRGMLADWYQLRARERSIAGDLWTDRGHQTGYYDRSLGDGPLTPARGQDMVNRATSSAIIDLATLVRQQGGTLILMVEPVNSESVDADAARSFVQSLESFASAIGVEVWDGFTIGWDRSLYADADHFNRAGTVAFSDWVAAELAALILGGSSDPTS